MKKTYRYATNADGSRELTYNWRYAKNGWGERHLKLEDVNALVFVTEMLDRLGYTYVR